MIWQLSGWVNITQGVLELVIHHHFYWNIQFCLLGYDDVPWHNP